MTNENNIIHTREGYYFAGIYGSLVGPYKTEREALEAAKQYHQKTSYQHVELATEQMSTSSYPALERDPAYFSDVFYSC